MAPSIVLPSQDTSSTSHNTPPSPTLSARSNRSFLDEDPYPDGSLRRASFSSANATPPPHQHHGQDLLAKLEGLLNSKANEIHLAGQLGAALLQQQQELETRIRELAEVQQNFASSPAGERRARGGTSTTEDSDGEKQVGEETRRRLQELEEDLRRWDEGNEGLYRTVGMAAAQGVPDLEALQQHGDQDPGFDGQQTPQRRPSSSSSTTTHIRQRAPSLSSHAEAPLPLPLPLPLSTTSALAQAQDPSASRRARNNAQHRNNDIELATEIGQSLLSEVRRLQALLAEKEEQVKEMTKERDAVEGELEGREVSRRVLEESVGESSFRFSGSGYPSLRFASLARSGRG